MYSVSLLCEASICFPSKGVDLGKDVRDMSLPLLWEYHVGLGRSRRFRND